MLTATTHTRGSDMYWKSERVARYASDVRPGSRYREDSEQYLSQVVPNMNIGWDSVLKYCKECTHNPTGYEMAFQKNDDSPIARKATLISLVDGALEHSRELKKIEKDAKDVAFLTREALMPCATLKASIQFGKGNWDSLPANQWGSICRTFVLVAKKYGLTDVVCRHIMCAVARQSARIDPVLEISHRKAALIRQISESADQIVDVRNRLKSSGD